MSAKIVVISDTGKQMAFYFRVARQNIYSAVTWAIITEKERPACRQTSPYNWPLYINKV